MTEGSGAVSSDGPSKDLGLGSQNPCVTPTARAEFRWIPDSGKASSRPREWNYSSNYWEVSAPTLTINWPNKCYAILGLMHKQWALFFLLVTLASLSGCAKSHAPPAAHVIVTLVDEAQETSIKWEELPETGKHKILETHFKMAAVDSTMESSFEVNIDEANGIRMGLQPKSDPNSNGGYDDLYYIVFQNSTFRVIISEIG